MAFREHSQLHISHLRALYPTMPCVQPQIDRCLNMDHLPIVHILFCVLQNITNRECKTLSECVCNAVCEHVQSLNTAFLLYSDDLPSWVSADWLPEPRRGYSLISRQSPCWPLHCLQSIAAQLPRCQILQQGECNAALMQPQMKQNYYLGCCAIFIPWITKKKVTVTYEDWLPTFEVPYNCALKPH